jgi:hypothetical protein
VEAPTLSAATVCEPTTELVGAAGAKTVGPLELSPQRPKAGSTAMADR